MNRIYLFAIVIILATASLMVSTFTSGVMARSPTTSESETGSTMNTSSSNVTAGNMTSCSTNSTTHR